MTCNLRCVQCDIYQLKNPPDELTAAERRGVIRQVAEWGPATRVVLSGGEPFNRASMIYEVAGEARERDVYVTLSTNGTQVSDEHVARLPGSGVRCVVVSLDSDEAAVHDRIRGRSGTFALASRAVRRLAATQCPGFSVLTSTILGAHNLHRVEEMVRCFEGLGAETTLFQPIQATFARPVEPGWWKADALFPRDAALIDRGIDTLIRLREAGRRIFQTREQLEDMRYYFRHPDRLRHGQCASMDRNLMVDMVGDVRLCFHMERIGLAPIGNVRERPLRQLWERRSTEGIREAMRRCREGCGSMVCHAR